MFDFVKPNNVRIGSLNEAVINYDTSEFTRMITESDSSIAKTIAAYRSLMSEALIESAGAVDSNAEIIMEEANETIGQKILRILKAVKDWIVKKLAELVLAIRTFVNSNKKALDKIAKEVKERLAKGEYKDGPTAELYDYKLGVIDIGKFSGKFDKVFKTGKFDLTGDFTLSNAEAVENSIKMATTTARDDIAQMIIDEVYSGPQKSKAVKSTLKDIAHVDIRNGGARKTVKFDKKYVDILEAYSKEEGDTKKGVVALFNSMSSEVDKMIGEVKNKLKDVKKDGTIQDKKLQSTRVAFYNAKIRVLNIAIDVLAMLNAIKLQAVIERAREAKKFCVKAYYYKNPAAKEKPVTESALDYPYSFSLLETDIEELDADVVVPDDEETVTEASW